MRSRGCSRGSDFKAGLCKTEVSGRGSYSNFFGNSSRAGLLNTCQERGRRADWPPRPGAGQVLGPSPTAPAPRRGTFSFASPFGPDRGGHPGGLAFARCQQLHPGLWPLSCCPAPCAPPAWLCLLLNVEIGPRRAAGSLPGREGHRWRVLPSTRSQEVRTLQGASRGTGACARLGCPWACSEYARWPAHFAWGWEPAQSGIPAPRPGAWGHSGVLGGATPPRTHCEDPWSR